MSYLRTQRQRGLGSTAASFRNLTSTPIKSVLGRAGTTLSASAASAALAASSTRTDDGPGTNGTLTNPDGSVTAYHVNSDGSLTVTAVYGSPSAGAAAPPPSPGLPPPLVSVPAAASGSSRTILILGAVAAAAFFFLKRH